MKVEKDFVGWTIRFDGRVYSPDAAIKLGEEILKNAKELKELQMRTQKKSRLTKELEKARKTVRRLEQEIWEI